MWAALVTWWRRSWPCFVLPWHSRAVPIITGPSTVACGFCGRTWKLKERR